MVFPPEYDELFGLVGIEAQSCGLPVISTDTGGIPEWCHDGETGLLVPMKSPQKLAEKRMPPTGTEWPGVRQNETLQSTRR